MTNAIKLLHPIYLDFSMMVSFVAAIEGGYSLENAIKRGEATTEDLKEQIAAEAGLSNILSNFLKINASGSANSEDQTVRSVESQVVFKHTEASLFMELREKLYKDRIISLDACEKAQWDILQVSPFSSLVELSGYIHRSPVNEIARLGNRFLFFDNDDEKQETTAKRQKNTDSEPSSSFIIRALNNDLKDSPLSDMLLEHDGKWKKSAVLNLSTEILSLTAQDRLLCGRVVVLGKATRILKEQESIDLYRRSLFGYFPQDTLEEITSSIMQLPGINIKLAPREVKYPAIEIIPMAIYV